MPRYGWVCNSCSYVSKNRRHVIRHVQSKHLDVKNVPCPLCEAHFATTNTRQIHVSKTHGLTLKNAEIEQMWQNKNAMV